MIITTPFIRMILPAFLLLSPFLTSATAEEDSAAPITCLILQDAETGQILVQEGPVDQRFSPCSSFKFPIAVMGFDLGILKDPHHPVLTYEKEASTNSNEGTVKVDPTIWLHDSIVWYSQQITPQIDRERFEDYVKKFDYGNQDVSGNPGKNDGLTQAWLMSSLQISTAEQVRFIAKFLKRELPVSDRAYDMTIATLPTYPTKEGWLIHGKSGSGWLKGSQGEVNESRPQGWFVGWAEKGKRKMLFARFLLGVKKSEVPGGTLARNEVIENLARWIESRH